MKRFIFSVLILSFISCERTTITKNIETSCFLEKVSNENGTFNSSFKYDVQNRVTNFTAFNSKLNFDISYEDSKRSKTINSSFLGQIQVFYDASGNITSAKTQYGDFSFQYDGEVIKQITVESNISQIVSGSKTTIFRFEFSGRNVKKVFLNKGSQFQNFLIFEGVDYDNNKTIYSKEAKEYFLIANIIGYISSNSEIDFSVISNNNVLANNIYNFKGTGYFANQKYSYKYNTDGYPVSLQYSLQPSGTIVIYNYSYICQ